MVGIRWPILIARKGQQKSVALIAAEVPVSQLVQGVLSIELISLIMPASMTRQRLFVSRGYAWFVMVKRILFANSKHSI